MILLIFTDSEASAGSNLSINVGGHGFTKLEKTRLLLHQMSALFAKRFHNFKRNFRALATQVKLADKRV